MWRRECPRCRLLGQRQDSVRSGVVSRSPPSRTFRRKRCNKTRDHSPARHGGRAHRHLQPTTPTAQPSKTRRPLIHRSSATGSWSEATPASNAARGRKRLTCSRAPVRRCVRLATKRAGRFMHGDMADSSAGRRMSFHMIEAMAAGGRRTRAQPRTGRLCQRRSPRARGGPPPVRRGRVRLGQIRRRSPDQLRVTSASTANSGNPGGAGTRVSRAN